MYHHFFLETTWLIWNFGKCAVAYCSMMMIIACFYYAFIEKEGYASSAFAWKDERKMKCLEMYIYVLCSYLIMAISLVYSSQSPLFAQLIKKLPLYVVMASVLAMTALTVVLENLPEFPEYRFLKIACWTLHSISMGPCLTFFGDEINAKAGIATACSVALANWMALTANTKFHECIKVRVVWLYLLVCVSTVMCLVYNPPLNALGAVWVSLNLFGGMLVYFCVYVTNIQQTIQDMEYNDVNLLHSAAVLFISSMNLFVRVAFFQIVEDTTWLHFTAKDSPCAKII